MSDRKWYGKQPTPEEIMSRALPGSDYGEARRIHADRTDSTTLTVMLDFMPPMAWRERLRLCWSILRGRRDD